MAYSTSTPPRLVTQAMHGPRTWEYSTADTAVGTAQGMRMAARQLSGRVPAAPDNQAL